jgi:hypothetical protein
MKPLILTLVLKIIALIGAVLNTAGFLTFFFWESLQPYRWPMIVGGIALIAVSEFISQRIAKEVPENDAKR